MTFDDGFRACYDVKEDIDTIEEFKGLEWIYGLWQQVKLDSSCTLGVAGHPAAKNLMYSSWAIFQDRRMSVAFKSVGSKIQLSPSSEVLISVSYIIVVSLSCLKFEKTNCSIKSHLI